MSRYKELADKASGCLKCGECMARCPFDVDVATNMERTAGVFIK